MLDLKFVDSVGGLLSGQTWPHPDFVSNIYSVVQQVHKCLLTNPGEDAHDPSYGSGLRAMISKLNGQQADKAKQLIGGAIQKVKADLSSGPQSTDPAERLTDLVLTELHFDLATLSWNVSVNVITEAGQSPLVVSV